MENKENAGTTLLFEDSLPDWYDGKRINEVLFCQQFLDKHPMKCCLLYTSPSPRDRTRSRMPSSA